MTIGITRWRRKFRSTHHRSRVLISSVILASALCLVALPSCSPSRPAQHPKLRHFSTAPEAEKINIQLLRLEYHVRSEGTPLVATAGAMGISTVGDSIGLEVFVSPLDAGIVRKFQFPGVTVRHVSMQYRRVLLVVNDLSLLYALARIPEVRAISPEYGATTQASLDGQKSISSAAEPTLAESGGERVAGRRTSAISGSNVYFGGVFDGR